MAATAAIQRAAVQRVENSGNTPKAISIKGPGPYRGHLREEGEQNVMRNRQFGPGPTVRTGQNTPFVKR